MIVGITGTKSAQREQLAKMIATEGRGAVVMSFSQQLKEVLTIMTGHTDFSEEGKEQRISGTSRTAGEMLNMLGDSWLNMSDTMLIVALCVKHSKSINDADRICIVTDVRRKREAEWIKQQGGITVCIAPDEEDKQYKGRRKGMSYERDMAMHVEMAMFNFDLVCEPNNMPQFAKAIVTYIMLNKNLDASPAEVKDKIYELIKHNQDGK